MPDGRLYNLTTKNLDAPVKGGSIFEITTPCGKVLLVDSLICCVNIVGVSRSTLISELGQIDKSGFIATIKGYKIKRIGILLKKKI